MKTLLICEAIALLPIVLLHTFVIRIAGPGVGPRHLEPAIVQAQAAAAQPSAGILPGRSVVQLRQDARAAFGSSRLPDGTLIRSARRAALLEALA